MRALVTGSTGFIGSQLCRALLARGDTVRAFHRASSSLRLLEGLEVEHALGDLTQPESLQAALEGVQIVFHAAAWMGGHDQPGRQYAVTVEGTRNLLQAAQAAGVQRVVHTSSAAALGIPALGIPASTGSERGAGWMNEQHTWNFRPDFYPYGYAKYLAEQEVQHAVAQGLDVVIVNPTVVFGAGDGYRRASSLVMQVAERRVSVITAGGVNCVAIDDVVAGHIAALERGLRGERYILGGENLTYTQLFQKLAEVTGTPAPTLALPTGLVRALAGPAGLAQNYLSLPVSTALLRLAGRYFFYDLQKSEQKLGLTHHTPLQDAFTAAYAWFQQFS